MNNLQEIALTTTMVRASICISMSMYKSTMRKERSLRKREVVLSRISVYIVVLMVSCHTVRIIPTVWEIVQTFTMDTDQVSYYITI